MNNNNNNMRPNQNNDFRTSPYNNPNFLGNWPTPQEATPNIHQTLAKLIGSIEKVDARVEKMEMHQMNRWFR